MFDDHMFVSGFAPIIYDLILLFFIVGGKVIHLRFKCTLEVKKLQTKYRQSRYAYLILQMNLDLTKYLFSSCDFSAIMNNDRFFD